MCGIVGGTDASWPFQRAVDCLRHRGPDSQRIVRNEGLVLGFTRLAVMDPVPAADQPMASGDESVWLVYNGEIYGFAALRTRLEGLGHRFRTSSDTEVVLNAYLEWGDAFVDRIDGMFALAIHDLREGAVKLARDRAGIKPLYYLWDGRDFAFASELKAVEVLAGGRLAVDATALYDFLSYGYVPAPKSLYRDVFKLEPASFLRFDLRRRSLSQPRRYWQLPVEVDRSLDPETACLELRRRVDASVDDQLVADVPVGFFLSGGMDSSVLVATAARRHSDLQTFSIGFEAPEHTETHYADEVARAFGTRHRVETFSSDALSQLFPRLKSWYDEPFCDTSAYPTYYVSQLARRSVTVALAGDGGDELFGGYRWYPAHLRYARVPRFAGDRRWSLGEGMDRLKGRFRPRSAPWWLFHSAAAFTCGKLALYVKLMGGMTRGEKTAYARLFEIPADYDDYWHFRRFWREELPPRTRLQYLDFHTYLPDDILTKVDRVSMANSLEVRVPYLSRDLLEFAFSVPESLRFEGGELKALVKRAYRDLLPPAILARGKQGFSIPPQYALSPGCKPQELILAELFGISLPE